MWLANGLRAIGLQSRKRAATGMASRVLAGLGGEGLELVLQARAAYYSSVKAIAKIQAEADAAARRLEEAERERDAAEEASKWARDELVRLRSKERKERQDG